LVFIENLKEILKNLDFRSAPPAKIKGWATSKKIKKNLFVG
jgi:hypothetical protein